MRSGNGVLEVVKVAIIRLIHNSVIVMMMSMRLLSMLSHLSKLVSSAKITSIYLSVVTEGILDSESVFVTSWCEDGIMKFLMTVSNSWDVFWGINYIWIIFMVLILLFSSVKSLGWVIEIKPIDASCS